MVLVLSKHCRVDTFLLGRDSTVSFSLFLLSTFFILVHIRDNPEFLFVCLCLVKGCKNKSSTLFFILLVQGTPYHLLVDQVY